MHSNYKRNHKIHYKITKRKNLYAAICAIIIVIVVITAIAAITNKEHDSVNNNSNDTANAQDSDNESAAQTEDCSVTDNIAETEIETKIETKIEIETKTEMEAGINTNTEKQEEDTFEYGVKVAKSEAVEDEYFSDAVFIGNSQIEGISIYKSMDNATVLAGKGVMVDTIHSKEVVKTPDGDRITIMEALSKQSFDKVYIMLGANELGWAYDHLFIEQYGKVIDEIKELQPYAKIYVNAIMPVAKWKSEKDSIYNNKNIDRYNQLILSMTKDKEIYYLDSKEAVGDEQGNLPEDAGSDGIHLNATYYQKWFDYLKTHTVK